MVAQFNPNEQIHDDPSPAYVTPRSNPREQIYDDPPPAYETVQHIVNTARTSNPPSYSPPGVPIYEGHENYMRTGNTM